MPEDSRLIVFDRLVKEVDYAVVVRSARVLRPLHARLLSGDPEDCLRVDFPEDVRGPEWPGWTDANEDRARNEYWLVGRWDEPCGIRDMTWQGLAKHAYGEVLRQHDLVARLARVGIVRSPEPYVLDSDAPNAVERSVILNFDELDQLLRAANA
jgi:hypothetical protein